MSSSWGVAFPVAWKGVEDPEGDARECSRLNEKERIQSSSTFTYHYGLHQFLDLALAVTHDGLKVSGFKNDTSSNQDNVVAAGQE